MGCLSDLCGLCGGAVVGLLGEEGVFLRKGCFVVEAGDTLDEISQRRMVGGVGAIGVGTNGSGWGGESAVGHECAIVERPIHSCFDIVDLRDGDVIEVYHVAADVASGRFLLQQIATTGDAMGEGEGGNLDRAVLIDDLWRAGVDFVEDDWVGGILAEVIYLRLKHPLQVSWPIHMEALKAS